MKAVKGAMKGTGRVGDTIFRKIKGVPGTFGGIVGGPTKTQVLNDPEFALTRENMAEFGKACMKLTAFVRSLLVTFLAVATRKQYWMRKFVMIVKEIQLLDTISLRGQRNIILNDTGTINQSFVGFEFNDRDSFMSRFMKALVITPSVGRNSATVTTASALVPGDFNAPKGANWARITLSMICLGNLEYDAATQTWIPNALAVNNGAVAEVTTAYLDVTTGASALNEALLFAGSPIMSATEAVMVCASIEFYQKVGANYNKMAQGNSGYVAAMF